MVDLLFYIIIWFSIYLIVALSLNLEYGCGGIPNFGKALAVLTGALAVGAIMNRILIFFLGISGTIIEASGAMRSVMNLMIQQNIGLGIALLIASIVLSGALGFLVGIASVLPCARLGQDYLAITLLVISEVVYITSDHVTDIAGGYYGVSVPDFLAWLPVAYRKPVTAIFVLLIAIIVFLLINKITESPYGRLIRAMRENEDVMKAYGANLFRLKIKTYALASVFAAIAGAIYSLYTTYVNVRAFGRIEWTFYPFLMVLLGGRGNNLGTILGVSIFVISRALLTIYKHELMWLLRLPFGTEWLEYILFGVLMLVILNYKPEGILKEGIVKTPPIKARLKLTYSSKGRR